MIRSFLILLFPLFMSWQDGHKIVLPADNFHSGWQPSGKQQVFSAENLYGHINGGAEVFLELGFKQLIVQEYVHDNLNLVLELFEMESEISALAIYLMRMGQESGWEQINARNSSTDYQVSAVHNRFFFQINNFTGNEKLKPVMISLANHFTESITPGKSPEILSLLPAQDLIPGTRRIIRGPFSQQAIYTLGKGDVLQLSGNIVGVSARYRKKGEEHSRIIIP